VEPSEPMIEGELELDGGRVLELKREIERHKVRERERERERERGREYDPEQTMTVTQLKSNSCSQK